jgi:four helix bundle protein
MYKFERLKVWQDAVVLVELIYRFSQQLPSEEKFVLIDQLKRAVTSIVLNIAEGCGSLGDTEFKSFLRNALKSLYETVAAVKIAEKLFNVSGSEVLAQSDLVGKELNGLIKSLQPNGLKTNNQ